MTPNYDGFTLKHRVFLVKNYYQYTGDYLCVKTKYDDNYKNSDSSPQFSYDALMEIINLFERTGSVFKNLDLEPSSQHIEHVYVKEDPDNRGRPVEIDPMAWDDGNDSFDSLGDVAADRTKVAKHSCDTCGMDFRGSDELTKHMKTHKKEAKFLCSYKSCKKSFNLWKDFNKHRESHKIEKHARTSFCCSCGDSFDKTSEQDTQCPNCSRRKFNDDDEDDGQMDDGVADDEDVPIAQRQSQVLEYSPGTSQDRNKDIVNIRSDIRNIFRQIAELKSIVLREPKTDNDAYSVNPCEQLDQTMEIPSMSSTSIFPLKSLDAMYKLEKDLEEDKELHTQLEGELIRMCGDSGKYFGNGRLCAYTLVDIFFKRYLLNSFTWTGSCRGTNTKRALREFKNILGLFFTLVNRADQAFTISDLDSFFKCILKNAKKRSTDGINHRASAPKNRKFKKLENSYEDIPNSLETETSSI